MIFDKAITEIVETWKILKEISNESSTDSFAIFVFMLPFLLPIRLYKICKYRQEEKKGW